MAGLLLVALLVACGGTQRPDDNLPAPHPDLQGAAAALSDSPMMLTTSVTGMKATNERFNLLVRSIPGAPPDFSILEELANEVDPTLLGGFPPLIDQLDPDRPLVVALRTTPAMERFAEVTQGVLPNMIGPEEPNAARLTVLLPTSDPAALESAISSCSSTTTPSPSSGGWKAGRSWRWRRSTTARSSTPAPSRGSRSPPPGTASAA